MINLEEIGLPQEDMNRKASLGMRAALLGISAAGIIASPLIAGAFALESINDRRYEKTNSYDIDGIKKGMKQFPS